MSRQQSFNELPLKMSGDLRHMVSEALHFPTSLCDLLHGDLKLTRVSPQTPWSPRSDRNVFERPLYPPQTSFKVHQQVSFLLLIMLLPVLRT